MVSRKALDLSVLPQLAEVCATDDEEYKVTSTLGHGAFGAVFKVKRASDGTDFALKAEPIEAKKAMLKTEFKVLCLGSLRHSRFLPKIHDRGAVEPRYRFIIMDLLGKSLWDLRKDQPTHRFTLNTVLRMGEQTLAGIRDLHEIEFLHRDVKPPNFSIGTADLNNTIFVLDFGMSRKNKYGLLKADREQAPFRGTARYASISALKGEEQSRKDDLEAWFYVMMESYVGSLPWKDVKPTDRPKVIEMKEELLKMDNFMAYAESLPCADLFWKMLSYITTMVYISIPDYEGLYRYLRKVARKQRIPESAPLDWSPRQPYDGPPFSKGIEINADITLPTLKKNVMKTTRRPSKCKWRGTRTFY